MALSKKEYLVIQELQRDPFITYNDLAERLEVSNTTIRNIINSLNSFSETENISEDQRKRRGKRTPLNFVALYDYKRLELKHASFLIECQDKTQMEIFENFCDLHPYTAFRSRIHGGLNGIYVIFHIPKEIYEFLIESLNILKEKGLIKRYRPLVFDSYIYKVTLPDFGNFDPETSEWHFPFKNKAQKMPSLSEKNLISQISKKDSQDYPIINNLDIIDIMILREWGYGAGPRKLKSEILNALTYKNQPDEIPDLYQNARNKVVLNRTILSNHIDKLMESDLIRDFIVAFDRERVLIYNRIFFQGTASLSFLQDLLELIEQFDDDGKRVFPFETVLTIAQPNKKDYTTDFTWWLDIPPKESSFIMSWLFEQVINLQTFLVSNRWEDTSNYPIWHENFIATKDSEVGGYWNVEKNYCLDIPLEELFKKHNIKE